MIDLDKLELKLDRALESETKESLTKWLESQRKVVLGDMKVKYGSKKLVYVK